MLAVLLHIQILGLLHPQAALVWPDNSPTPVEARPGETYGKKKFFLFVEGMPRRGYPGRLLVRAGQRELELINEVELEEYVASVVGAELSGAPPAAAQALAVVARSFALHAEAAGHLCDTTHCQWYRGLEGANPAAAAATKGDVLLLPDGRVAPAFHSQDCHGHTAKARDVWPAASPDAEEASTRSFDPHPPSAEKGRGHGVGLCQRGALFWASKGATAHQILARYFPKLRIGQR